ncbi:uncharacterized protein [Gossypium hirsutum]|uniref:Integrase catalytic domain-containing protein n=1 Tax=Gossypium hirsutum TaxID=3635 RepID=A0A1U8NFN5_GOSHI|nr:uncharacterized protein LOC107947790 [Gossypium hirsutum]
MGPFPPSWGKIDILVNVDYVYKWVEVVDLPTNDVKSVLRFLHTNIFTRFGALRALIRDEGLHFDYRIVANALNRYEVKHKIASAYHPLANGQAKISNREIKQILEKVVNPNCKGWSARLMKPCGLIAQLLGHH